MNEKETADLLTATGRQSAPIDRRQSVKRRVRRDRRKGVQRSVGLDVSPSGVSLAIVERSGDSQKLIVERIAFEDGSGPSRGDWSDGTLRELLTDLAAKHNLAGQAVLVGLGGEPCVTRVVAGDNETVEHELSELSGRTPRYIGMGLGEKVTCQTSTRLDAKHKRVWVTVATRSLVDAVADATRLAGMRLSRLEHSMLVLCRILHAFGEDDHEPVLMIVDECGRVDLGISYRGRMLLDYRPAMPDTSASRGSIIQRHLKCLRRYIQAQLPNSSGGLAKIFLTGSDTDVASLSQSLDERSTLERNPFPIEKLCDGLEVRGEVTQHAGTITAIALATLPNTTDGQDSGHDLVSVIQTKGRFPWMRLMRLGWPIGLACSLALALVLLGHRTRHAAKQIESRLESLEARHAQVNRVRLTVKRRKHRDEQLAELRRSIRKPRWAQTLWKTGMSLTQNMWLDSVEMDQHSTVRIVGSSHADEAVYDYIDRLRELGIFSRVALESTSSMRLNDGPVFRFEISARVKAPALENQQASSGHTKRRPNHG